MQVREAVKILGCSRQQVHTLLRSGALRGHQNEGCGCWILDSASVEHYLTVVMPKLNELKGKYRTARSKILKV